MCVDDDDEGDRSTDTIEQMSERLHSPAGSEGRLPSKEVGLINFCLIFKTGQHFRLSSTFYVQRTGTPLVDSVIYHTRVYINIYICVICHTGLSDSDMPFAVLCYAGEAEESTSALPK